MLRLVFALLAICLFASFVLAQDQVVSSAEFTVRVGPGSTGTPQWRFWQNDNASYVYKINFRYLFEAENMTSSTINFVANSDTYPATGWNFGTPMTVNASSSVGVINNNPTGPSNPNGLYRFNHLSFNSSVPLGSVNGSAYAAGKFDIDIENYQWVSMNEEAQLVLVFSLDYEYNGAEGALTAENITQHGSRTANVLGSFFSINSTAMGGPGKNVTTDVSLKYPSSFSTSTVSDIGTQDIYVVFDHFDNDLHHDPEFGFGQGPGNSYIWIIIIVVVVIAIIVIILIAVIGFILVRRRRRSYDAF